MTASQAQRHKPAANTSRKLEQMRAERRSPHQLIRKFLAAATGRQIVTRAAYLAHATLFARACISLVCTY